MASRRVLMSSSNFDILSIFLCFYALIILKDESYNTHVRFCGRWASEVIEIREEIRIWPATNFKTRHVQIGVVVKKTGYTKTRISYYNNSSATFNHEYLVLCGDIEPNPGPNQGKCLVCNRVVARNHRQLQCVCCLGLNHIRCAGVTLKEYKQLLQSFSYKCSSCINRDLLYELPFANVLVSNSSANDINVEPDTTWERYDQLIVQQYRRNVKLGHINANGIGGFKFHEITNWLLGGKLDILVISETKLDASFPNGQFYIHGFRLHRVDRNTHGGGIMVYVRADICSSLFKDHTVFSTREWGKFKTELIVLKVKIGKQWNTVAGVYRPPSIPKCQWKVELELLFEAVLTKSHTVFLLGDYNCDLLTPDKPPRDGRDLLDILDIYDLKNVIKSPTRVGKTSNTLLDLILTNNKRKIIASGVVDVHISDHSLIYAVVRISVPHKRSREQC